MVGVYVAAVLGKGIDLKKKFLDELFKILNTEMSKEEAYEHVNYYDEYICSEIASGVPEEEVIEELGSPRLIAKTILSSGKSEKNHGKVYEEESEIKKSGVTFRVNGKEVSPILARIIVWVVIALVLALVFLIIFGVLKIVNFLVAKLLLPILLVWIIVMLFKTILKK